MAVRAAYVPGHVSGYGKPPSARRPWAVPPNATFSTTVTPTSRQRLDARFDGPC